MVVSTLSSLPLSWPKSIRSNLKCFFNAIMWSLGFYDSQRAPRPSTPKQIRVPTSPNFKKTPKQWCRNQSASFVVNNGAAPYKNKGKKETEPGEVLEQLVCIASSPFLQSKHTTLIILFPLPATLTVKCRLKAFPLSTKKVKSSSWQQRCTWVLHVWFRGVCWDKVCDVCVPISLLAH